MAGAKAGGDRQELHELIRRHSQAAAEQVKLAGEPNDLLDRLAREPAFRSVDLAETMDPARFVGRAPQQVQQFISGVVAPIRKRYGARLSQPVDLRV